MQRRGAMGPTSSKTTNISTYSTRHQQQQPHSSQLYPIIPFTTPSTQRLLCQMCADDRPFGGRAQLEMHYYSFHFRCLPYRCEHCADGESTQMHPTEQSLRTHYELYHGTIEESMIHADFPCNYESIRHKVERQLAMAVEVAAAVADGGHSSDADVAVVLQHCPAVSFPPLDIKDEPSEFDVVWDVEDETPPPQLQQEEESSPSQLEPEDEISHLFHPRGQEQQKQGHAHGAHPPSMPKPTGPLHSLHSRKGGSSGRSGGAPRGGRKFPIRLTVPPPRTHLAVNPRSAGADASSAGDTGPTTSKQQLAPSSSISRGVSRKIPKTTRYRCAECQKELHVGQDSRGSLLAHINKYHTKYATYVCSICNMEFTQLGRSAVVQHLRYEHHLRKVSNEVLSRLEDAKRRVEHALPRYFPAV